MPVNELLGRRGRQRVMPSDQRALREVADDIGSTVHDVLVSVRSLALAVENLADGVQGVPNSTTRSDLETLHPLIESLIEQHCGLLLGAGFVADPDFLQDVAHWLDWRQAIGGGYSSMEVTLDANDVANYDYIHAEWFEVPKSGAPFAIVGPYVDLGGTNAYTITITVPVRLGDSFLGVAGADISVDRVEGLLRRMTRTIGLAAMVVTDEGRVIASSVPRQCPGTLLRDLNLDVDGGKHVSQGLLAFDCAGLPWRLVVLGFRDG